jgi:hypothetical protein
MEPWQERRQRWLKEDRRREEKRRRLRKFYWYMGGDHLIYMCDCHDCRKRKKRTWKSPLQRRELRERAKVKEEREDA